MRISDWSSDVCSSDLCGPADGEAALLLEQPRDGTTAHQRHGEQHALVHACPGLGSDHVVVVDAHRLLAHETAQRGDIGLAKDLGGLRSEEHTSELQSLMRLSSAVLCLKKKNKT